MFFFSSQIYLKAIFHTAQSFLNKLKIFMLPILLLKWNNLCCTDLFFVSLDKLLSIRLDEYNLFLNYLKSVFFMLIESKQKRLY